MTTNTTQAAHIASIAAQLNHLRAQHNATAERTAAPVLSIGNKITFRSNGKRTAEVLAITGNRALLFDLATNQTTWIDTTLADLNIKVIAATR